MIGIFAVSLGLAFAGANTAVAQNSGLHVDAMSPAAAEQLLQDAIATMKALPEFECQCTLNLHLSGGDRSPGIDATDLLDISGVRSTGFKMTMDGRPVPARGFRSDMAVNQFLNADAACLFVTCDLDNLSEGPPPVKPVITALPEYASFGGKRCQVISYKIGGGFPEEYRFFIGPDKIIYRVYHYADNMGKPYIYDSEINQLNLQPNLVASDFEPKADSRRRREAPTGIAAGAIAPGFTLRTPDGKQTSLKEAMQGKKALLLNFWFIDCPPCRSEHPHLDALQNELDEKGFGVLSIDMGDNAANVAKYLQGADLKFHVALGGSWNGPDSKQLAPYKVESCPTNILIDCSTGKVVSRASGWNEAQLRATLADMGIK